MFAPPCQRHLDDLQLPEEDYANLEHPTLLTHGRDDHIIPLKTSLFLPEHLPYVQLHVFGRCGHWTMIEYRHAFNRLLEDFFGEEA
jgi:pimeloyl-ACP methyl ester carboxylesterase